MHSLNKAWNTGRLCCHRLFSLQNRPTLCYGLWFLNQWFDIVGKYQTFVTPLQPDNLTSTRQPHFTTPLPCKRPPLKFFVQPCNQYMLMWISVECFLLHLYLLIVGHKHAVSFYFANNLFTWICQGKEFIRQLPCKNLGSMWIDYHSQLLSKPTEMFCPANRIHFCINYS